MEKQLARAERRLATNYGLSVLIEVGLTFQQTQGDTAARQFYVNRRIPDELAARVLSRPAGRRQARL